MSRRLVRRRVLACLALVLGAVGAGACGGGSGGSSGTPEPELPLDGLRGRAFSEGVDLGRFAESEPNDSTAQPCRVAPLHPRSRIAVAGTVGVGAGAFGAADPTDVFRIETLASETRTLTLAFAEADLVGGGANTLRIEAFLTNGFVPIAADEGTTSPRSIVVDATAGEAWFVHVTAVGGHAPYVLSIVANDAVSPAPILAAPTFTTRDARREAARESLPGAGRETSACATSHVLAGFVEGADPAAIAAAVGATLGRRLGGGGWCLELDPSERARGPAGIDDLLARLRAHPSVRWSERDACLVPLGTPGDALFAEQWNLHAIGARGAWDLTTGDPSVVIGVVDSGVIDHPDLAGRVVEGHDFISSSSIAGDGDGRDADARDEGDRLLASGLSTWHGTHVASIAVANHDGAGIAGVAPGCRVMPLRVVGRGGGLVSDAADAILFAAGLLTTSDGRRLAEPLRVVNLSLGTSSSSDVLEDACRSAADAGVLLVAAVGNDGGSLVMVPARYPSVMAVAAVDRSLQSTAYSNFGPEVELAAPGGNTNDDRAGVGWTEGVLGAWRDQTVEPAALSHGRYMGTSQATPHVAAAAALLFSIDPTLTAEAARGILRQTARDLAPIGEDIGTGSGLLDVHAAVRRAREGLALPDARPPRLGLGWSSVVLVGLEDRDTVPVGNDGGGHLVLGPATAWTDDGGSWLSAELAQPGALHDGISHLAITVIVDRFALDDVPWSTGFITVRDVVGTPIGRILVNVARGVLLRQGTDLSVAAFPASGGGSALRATRADADRGHRFWLTSFPQGLVHLRAAEDIDRDGIFGELGDATGWWDGPDPSDAIDLDPAPGLPAGAPIDIRLHSPP